MMTMRIFCWLKEKESVTESKQRMVPTSVMMMVMMLNRPAGLAGLGLHQRRRPQLAAAAAAAVVASSPTAPATAAASR
jgi:hypothetical protein